MRLYGSIRTCFWENEDAQKLSDQGKLLATYLLTGPHSNMLGCFRLPAGYITEDLRWDIQKVKAAFHELHELRFIARDQTSGWVFIHHFLKWNPIQNPKQAKGVQKLFDAVPLQSTVSKPLIQDLLNHGKYFDEAFKDRLHTLTIENGQDFDTVIKKQRADQDQNQNQDQKQNQKDKDISLARKSLLKNSPKLSLKTQAIEILQFLNEKTHRAYRPVDSNIKLIMARLKSGATVMDCRQVIAKKTREWKGNDKMAEYLRPATLFNATKFEQYLGELVEPDAEEETHESLS
ncbi:MAG: hypothetical protein K0R24_1723 [Gammaproteobacteria bacterium]|jgi:uncharacterized phage protein (TIGR02220 family)|nr:hypothetical protein [Gammaproteobacteria bacterium]